MPAAARSVGFVDNGTDLDEPIALVGPIASLERLVQQYGVDEIVVALPPTRREQLGRIIARGFGRPVQVKFAAADLGELLPERFELHPPRWALLHRVCAGRAASAGSSAPLTWCSGCWRCSGSRR